MNFKELALKEESYILEQRRWLHAHPELGTKEYKTTEHIVNELKSFGIEVQVFDDITGCVGIIRGKQPGRTVMRAQISTHCRYRKKTTAASARRTMALCMPAGTTAIRQCCWLPVKCWRRIKISCTER